MNNNVVIPTNFVIRHDKSLHLSVFMLKNFILNSVLKDNLFKLHNLSLFLFIT